MGEYLIYVVTTSFVLGILCYLSYPGAMERSARIAGAVLLLCAVWRPGVSLLSSASDFLGIVEEIREGDYFGKEEYLEITKEAFEDGIKELVISEFSLEEEGVKVKVFDLDFEKMKAGKIKIVLSGESSLADWRKIESFVNSAGLGNCEVVISFG